MPTTLTPLGSPLTTGIPTPATIPSTGYPFSRYLHGTSGDYVVDAADGLYSAMPSVRQRVVIIARTTDGSSSTLRKLGITKPERITPSLTRVLEKEFRKQFAPMIDDEKSMVLEGLSVTTSGLGRVEIEISYMDLTTGEPDIVKVSR